VSLRNLRAAAVQGTLPDLEIRHLSREEVTTASLDVVVLARESFGSIDELLTYRRRLACNVLVVVDRDEEEEVLAGLLPGDDIARPDASAPVLSARVERVALAGVTQLDSLTRVLSRGAFLERLARALDTASADRPISLLVVDIDYFKRINDELGHLGGDELLRGVAMRLRDQARWDARIGRIGGEEFGLFLTGDAALALPHAESIREAIKSEPFPSGVAATVSIGIATAAHQTDATAILRRADEALYAAKAGGRDRCVHYDDFAREAAEAGEDAEMVTFENLTRVIAERVAEAITYRGRRVFDALRAEADRDSLTGLYSRRYLDRRLPFEVDNARERGASLTVALVDLDNFGAVNKEHGWPTGDRVLRDVARTIQGMVRDDDWVARYGGEEILLALHNTGPEGAALVLERIRDGVEKLRHELREGGELEVTVSVGAASLRSSEDMLELLERSSEALLRAKRGGKNRVVMDG
jgi:diguanylate cyclase (GGDEF)-like protein